MAEVTAHRYGAFCFIEAGSPDISASCRFATAMFGWTAEERLVSDDVAYMRFLKRGRPVAGMYPLASDPRAPVVPCQWLPYVSVADTRAVLEDAIASGAVPLGDVVDAPNVAVVAEFADPTGAVCGLWQSQGHMGSGYLKEPGTLTWAELVTDEPGVAAPFYCEIFGWTSQALTTPDGAYHLFRQGGEVRAGMKLISADGEADPRWRAHVGTKDLEAAVDRLGRLGGTVDGEAFAVASMGRAVAARDPSGVSFALMEPTMQE